jgi:hypothetical protein
VAESAYIGLRHSAALLGLEPQAAARNGTAPQAWMAGMPPRMTPMRFFVLRRPDATPARILFLLTSFLSGIITAMSWAGAGGTVASVPHAPMLRAWGIHLLSLSSCNNHKTSTAAQTMRRLRSTAPLRLFSMIVITILRGEMSLAGQAAPSP